jgi:twitching motility protein PilJ
MRDDVDKQIMSGRLNLLVLAQIIIAILLILLQLFGLMGWADGLRTLLQVLATLLAAGMLLTSVALILMLKQRARTLLAQQQEINIANQTAVAQLSEEISQLSEGRLDVRASENHPLTASVARTFNLALAELRSLVKTVDMAGHSLGRVIRTHQDAARDIVTKSEVQTQETSRVLMSLRELQDRTGVVNGAASQTRDVAGRAMVEVEQGDSLIQGLMADLNRLRDQVKDTGNRIKRLGETTQKIGDIVSTIDDISDQTSVLALNASIQASMAGEPGKGFAVVAEEVQRLAERSSSATNNIKQLVLSVKADAQSTQEAMEIATRMLVEGSGMAQGSGKVLTEVLGTAREIRRLVDDISESTNTQVNTMKTLVDSVQTLESKAQDAQQSAHNLSGMVQTLNELSDNLSTTMTGSLRKVEG